MFIVFVCEFGNKMCFLCVGLGFLVCFLLCFDEIIDEIFVFFVFLNGVWCFVCVCW